jgi:hypothetical protein
MTLIQIKLSEEENKKVNMYKAQKDCKTKEAAIKKIIQEK